MQFIAQDQATHPMWILQILDGDASCLRANDMPQLCRINDETVGSCLVWLAYRMESFDLLDVFDSCK